jgi:hypothetical protein
MPDAPWAGLGDHAATDADLGRKLLDTVLRQTNLHQYRDATTIADVELARDAVPQLATVFTQGARLLSAG